MDWKEYQANLDKRAVIEAEVEVSGGEKLAVKFQHPTPERIFAAGGEAFGALVTGGKVDASKIPAREQMEVFASMRRICAEFYIEPNLQGGRADALPTEDVTNLALAVMEAAGLAGGEREAAERFPDGAEVES